MNPYCTIGSYNQIKYQLNNIVLVGMVSAIWIIVCIALFVGFDGELSWVVLTLFFLFSYASTMLWRTVFSRRVAPLELMFWLFHTNFLLLPALSQSVYRTFYWSSYNTYSLQDLLLACGIIFVGLLAFRFGTGFAYSRLRGESSPLAGKNFLARPLRPSWRSQVFLVVILVGLAWLVSMLGTEFYTSDRMSKLGQVDSLPELGLLLSLPRALSLGVLLFSIALLVHGWRDNREDLLGSAVIFIISLGINLIINYPLSVPRFWFFGFIISLIWLVKPLCLAGWRSAFVIAMTVMQFTIFPLYSQITRGGGWIGLDVESIRKYLHHGDFDGFQSIVNITLHIRENGFELGRNLISTILFFVPRDIWVSKAEPLGVAASSFMGYEYTNLSAPIYGEFYADYGLLSVIAGMALTGWVIKKSDCFFDHIVKTKQFCAGVVLVSTLAGYLIILLRGSLLGVVPSIATLVALLVAASWLTKRTKERTYNNFRHSRREGINQ